MYQQQYQYNQYIKQFNPYFQYVTFSIIQYNLMNSQNNEYLRNYQQSQLNNPNMINNSNQQFSFNRENAEVKESNII